MPQALEKLSAQLSQNSRAGMAAITMAMAGLGMAGCEDQYGECSVSLDEMVKSEGGINNVAIDPVGNIAETVDDVQEHCTAVLNSKSAEAFAACEESLKTLEGGLENSVNDPRQWDCVTQQIICDDPAAQGKSTYLTCGGALENLRDPVQTTRLQETLDRATCSMVVVCPQDL